MARCEQRDPLWGRIFLLLIIAVFVCVLVALGQELAAVITALGTIATVILAMSASPKKAGA